MSEGNTYVHAQYTCDYPYHVEADMAPVHTAATEDLEFDCDPTPRGLTMLPLPDTPGCEFTAASLSPLSFVPLSHPALLSSFPPSSSTS